LEKESHAEAQRTQRQEDENGTSRKGGSVVYT
jgi:hypothetical protein